jgi:hypothetical protein
LSCHRSLRGSSQGNDFPDRGHVSESIIGQLAVRSDGVTLQELITPVDEFSLGEIPEDYVIVKEDIA